MTKPIAVRPPKPEPPIFAYLVAGVVAVGLAATCFRGSSEPDPEDLRADAPFMCQEFVKRRLKAPATAEFPNPYSEGTATVPFDSVTFVVSSYVDAENAFSAKLRTNYTCTVRKAEGDTWELVALELAER